jgi:hypothetical protein
MGFRAASRCYTGGSLPVTQKGVFMETSGITATLPAQDLGRARAFYAERVGLQAAEADFLEATDGRVGLMVRDGVNQLFVYPARARSSGEFMQAVSSVGRWLTLSRFLSPISATVTSSSSGLVATTRLSSVRSGERPRQPEP